MELAYRDNFYGSYDIFKIIGNFLEEEDMGMVDRYCLLHSYYSSEVTRLHEHVLAY